MKLGLYSNGACLHPRAITADGKFWMRHSWMTEWARRHGPVTFLGLSKRLSGIDRELYPESVLTDVERTILPPSKDMAPLEEYVERLRLLQLDALFVEMSAGLSQPICHAMCKVVVAACKHLRIPTIVADGDVWTSMYPTWLRNAVGRDTELELKAGKHPHMVVVSSPSMEAVRASGHWHLFSGPTGIGLRSLIYCYDPAWRDLAVKYAGPDDLSQIKYALVYIGKNYHRTPLLIQFYQDTDCRIYGWEPEFKHYKYKNPEVKAIGADRFDWYETGGGVHYRDVFAAYRTGAASVGLNHKKQWQFSMVSTRSGEATAAGRLALFDSRCPAHEGCDVPYGHCVTDRDHAVYMARRARREPSWLFDLVQRQHEVLCQWTPDKYVDRMLRLFDDLQVMR